MAVSVLRRPTPPTAPARFVDHSTRVILFTAAAAKAHPTFVGLSLISKGDAPAMRWFALATVPLALWAGTPQLAILPLTPHGVDSSSAAVLGESLSDAFLRTGVVRVMERQQIDEVLKEQGFEKSGACDASECAVKVGQILGIDQIVVGSIGKLGKTFVLSLRRVDVGTGKVIATSSRNKSGAIDDLLDVIDNSVQDLIGSLPKEQAAPVAESSHDPVEIPRHGVNLTFGIESSNLPARTAKALEPGFRTTRLELGRDPNSGVNDLFVWKDSSGSQAGWVRLSRRASDPELGGAGEAVLVSGNPGDGQRMEKLAQAPWALEACSGTESWFSSSDTREVLDLTALLWYRSTAISGFLIGGGILLDVNRLQNGSLEVAPGAQIALHKGFTLQKRLGWFVEGAIASTPTSEWRPNVQILLKPGLSWDIEPGLQLEATVGRNLWGAEGLVSNTSEGGQYLYTAALVWSPTYGPKPSANKRNGSK
jgi:hypothetical protein